MLTSGLYEGEMADLPGKELVKEDRELTVRPETHILLPAGRCQLSQRAETSVTHWGCKVDNDVSCRQSWNDHRKLLSQGGVNEQCPRGSAPDNEKK